MEHRRKTLRFISHNTIQGARNGGFIDITGKCLVGPLSQFPAVLKWALQSLLIILCISVTFLEDTSAIRIESFFISDHGTGCSDFLLRYLLEAKDQRSTKMADRATEEGSEFLTFRGKPTAGGNEDSQRGLVS